MINNKTLKDIRVLKDLLTSVVTESKFSYLLSPLERYFYLFEKDAKNQGALEAILKCKRVYHVCLNQLLHQEAPDYHLLSIDKDGWPKMARGLRPLSDSPEEIRFVLTLLSAFRAITVKGKPDFSSITEPGKDIPEELLVEISKDVKPLDLSDYPVEYQCRSKSGPNGQAVRTAVLDLLALKDSGLLHHLDELLQLQDAYPVADDIDSILEIAASEKPTKHSKLSYKYEAGGKVRIFAICDYYSQMALLPLHQAVAKRLSHLRQDFTWDQVSFGARYDEWILSGWKHFESIDLSAATDRFPAILQKKVVEKLVGPKFANHWYHLMTDRVFQSPEGEKKYSVGQPMGAYSSWPVFAYTHHLVVRYAAKLVGIRNPEYAIVGDDIVIPGHTLSRKYREVLEQLGVPISSSKSLSGFCAEFCKRIWSGPWEVTPIPTTLLLDCDKHPESLIQLVKWCFERKVSIELLDILLKLLMKDLSPELKFQLSLCMTAPWNGWAYSGGLFREELAWPDLAADMYEYILASFNLQRLEVTLGQLFQLTVEWLKPNVSYDGDLLGYLPQEITDHPGISAGFESDFLPINRVISLLPDLTGRTIQTVVETFGSGKEHEIKARSYDFRILMPDYRSKRPKVLLHLTPRIYKICSGIKPWTDLRDYDLYLPTKFELGANSLSNTPRDNLKKRLLSERPFWRRVWDKIITLLKG